VITIEGPLAALAASPWIAGPKSLLLGWILGAAPVGAIFAKRKVTAIRAYAIQAPFLGLVAAVAFASVWGAWARDWLHANVTAPTFAVLFFLPLVGIPVFGALVALAFIGWKSRAAPEDVHRRGALIELGAKAQRETIREKRKHGTALLTVAGIAIPELDEMKHFKILGTTGSGKSTAIRELIGQALERRDRVIFADPDFGYVKRFYDPRRGDLILNPFDERSRKWDLFAEIKQPYDIEQLARSLMPREGEWTEYARILFTGVCRHLHEHGPRDVGELYRLLAQAPIEELRTVVAGTVAEPAVAESNERMFSSMRMVMATAVSSLDHLRKQRAAALSIRQWVREGRESEAQGALFLPYSAGQIAALSGILSTWMRLAIFETMEGPEESQRIWFVIDELDALGAIDGLKDALARLRKFGGRCILGFQSIGLVRALYGDGEDRAIVENCGNTLILRCSASEGGGTARFASQLIGEREVLRTVTSSSKSRGAGIGQDRDAHSTTVRKVVEDAVMASEIEQLPDLVGYLKLASRPEWLYLRLPVPK
jgi:type IV secretory pathway TraG/TraD family ATPase VirD4